MFRRCPCEAGHRLVRASGDKEMGAHKTMFVESPEYAYIAPQEFDGLDAEYEPSPPSSHSNER